MKKLTKDKKILYFYAVRMSFVAKDIDLLKEKYMVTEFHFDTKMKKRIPWQFFSQFVFLVRNIFSSDIFICFFAGYHSVLPALFGKVFRKHVLIFLGGADTYRYPTFNYGHFNKFLIANATCYSAKLADRLLPVHECLIYSESDYYDKAYAKQGIMNFCPALKTPFTTIYLEYDSKLFNNKSEYRNKHSFLTVAFGIEGPSFIRKGVDLIIDVAKLLPECEFTVLGCTPEVIKVPFTENVKFLPPVPYDQLPEYYSRNRFYLQLSIAEGFPSAICEAMLCECVPIGSSVAAIPMIIGDTGYVLDKRDVIKLKEIITEAKASDDLDEMGRKARQRIMQNFYPGVRSDKIYEIIDGL